MGGRRSAEHGFTLIEIMVALAVFSLGVLALVRLESATIRGAGAVDTALGAGIVARNVAVEAMTDARPPTGGTARGIEVNGGRRWGWIRDVRGIGDAGVLRIDVSVTDPQGVVRARTTMVRPATEPTA